MKTDHVAHVALGLVLCILGLWSLMGVAESIRGLWRAWTPTTHVSDTTTSYDATLMVATSCTPQDHLQVSALAESLFRTRMPHDTCRVQLVHVATGDVESCAALKQNYVADAQLITHPTGRSRANAISYAVQHLPEGSGNTLVLLEPHTLFQRSVCQWLSSWNGTAMARLEAWGKPWQQVCQGNSYCAHVSDQEAILRYSIGFPIRLRMDRARVLMPV